MFILLSTPLREAVGLNMDRPAWSAKSKQRWPSCSALLLLLGMGSLVFPLRLSAETPKPALTVTSTRPEIRDWPENLAAVGRILPWREVAVGAEIGGERIRQVLVDLGAWVEAGKPLVVLDDLALRIACDQAQAALAEAEAALAEARANAKRARQLKGTAGLSEQQAERDLIAEQMAQARLEAARARLAETELRLARTRINAPVAGIVSALHAIEGALVQPGQELVRLIHDGRLEWRAEVADTLIHRLAPGMSAWVQTPDGGRIEGQVRLIEPSIDPRTLTGRVLVQFPVAETRDRLRPGMFVRGSFALGHTLALTLPQTAVQLEQGQTRVFVLGRDQRVHALEVKIGRRLGDRVEVLSGLGPEDQVVERGVGFLNDGDLVRIGGP
ncbi:efflux RND transporter periplasmic adaptor subunit [Caldichromatium japonicum]|uniref:Efflux RND transporter periplasmic adaptor subunit n=1 Tax=Caldichromatium japonicum TaxID=2699430 RepID=A0A6G7VBP0_9GAMM|nr:efflux RND transporter periplasmic adaptor subunit [Caldichromatium japonicum]QIK37493.1 efflux RND transporter periplasmic adaptor subunit [Caldichromatium japonicum]